PILIQLVRDALLVHVSRPVQPALLHGVHLRRHARLSRRAPAPPRPSIRVRRAESDDGRLGARPAELEFGGEAADLAIGIGLETRGALHGPAETRLACV